MSAVFTRHRLEDLATSVDYGVTASAKNTAIGPLFLRITDIQDDFVDWSTVPFCDITPSEEESARLAPGDIVFARTGATTGKSYLLRTCPNRAVFASYLIRVRPRQSCVDPRYLAWYFQTPEYWRQITSSSAGSAQPGVNASKLKALTVPLPDFPEQRRIADILDKADAIRRKRKQAIALTDQLLRSTFLEMFGDPVTNPKGWPSVPVESIAKVEKNALAIGPFGSNLLSSDYRAAGHPVIFVRDIVSGSFHWKSKVFVNDEKFMELAAHRAVPGDVLITKMGDPPGVACVLPTEFPDSIITADVVKVSANRALIHPEYLATMINSPFCQEQIGRISAGITRQKMTLRDFRQLEIRLPPLSEQSRYLGFVRRFERLRDHLKAAERDAQTLFSSLVDRAFRGELSRLEQVGKQLQMFSK